MSEVKDPKIKLFGKTIELPENSAAADEGGEPGSAGSCEAAAVGDNNSSNQDPPCSSDSVLEDGNFLSRDAEEQESVKPPSDPAKDHTKDEDQPEPSKPDELKDSNAPPPVVDDSKTEEDQTETANSNEKTLKKPDKILPCPRCNSMDTKFCYFNNYNVNQPRHFCKNCQRYWTAGGSMRNVPVGAGRRKNKNPISQFRHLTVPEALQANTARVDLPNGILSPNGTVLTFGSDSPLCESITSVLNIVDKTDRNGSKNGFHRPEENGDALSSRSSITSSESEPMINRHPFSPQVPCYPGPRWPYPWPPPAFSPASFPVPFYSTAPPYWGWNVPWVIPPGPTHSTSGPNSPTLGKHSRDENNVKDDSKEEETLKQSNPEKCLWVPKTLRIDDPGEAAKSSIWATLGIKNDMADCGGGGDGGGLFKAFRSESKGDEKARVSESSTVLQANPAALSRSLSFHENT